MKKLCLLLMALVILILCPACSDATLKNIEKELEDGITNVSDSDNKYVLMVKGGYRESNHDLTYDKMFSAFFGTPRWKYFKSDDGLDVVEFTGDCTYQEVPVKARIQFVVDEGEGTFEATYLAFNEVPQSNLILLTLLEKAYETALDAAELEKGGDDNDYPAGVAGSSWILGSPAAYDEHTTKINFYDNEEFLLNVNLYEAMGSIYGTYSIKDGVILCIVKERDFMGFAGDDVEGFSLWVYEGPQGDCLVYKGETIGEIDEEYNYMFEALNM